MKEILYASSFQASYRQNSDENSPGDFRFLQIPSDVAIEFSAYPAWKSNNPRAPFRIRCIDESQFLGSFMDHNLTSHRRPWNLADVTLADVRNARYEVAVLPLGATEPHNLHLPYATDTLEADYLGNAICSSAWEQGARVVLLPTIPYGPESNLQQFPLAMNLQPTTVFRVLKDLITSLETSGIRKLLLLNSHGGNDLKPFLREMYGQTRVQLFLCNWYQMVRDAATQIFDQPEDHAGEMETSVILACRPDLVAKNADGKLTADEGCQTPFRFTALQNGWVSITRPWHLLTTQSGSGNPHAASSEKGHRILAVIRERLVPFLVELSKADMDDRFPFLK